MNPAKPVLLMWLDTSWLAGVFITLSLYQFDRGK